MDSTWLYMEPDLCWDSRISNTRSVCTAEYFFFFFAKMYSRVLTFDILFVRPLKRICTVLITVTPAANNKSKSFKDIFISYAEKRWRTWINTHTHTHILLIVQLRVHVLLFNWRRDQRFSWLCINQQHDAVNHQFIWRPVFELNRQVKYVKFHRCSYIWIAGLVKHCY